MTRAKRTVGFDLVMKATILWRDGELCAMCGKRATEANHRLNRGAGGRPSLNTFGNACALCSWCNLLIERDAFAAQQARELGVKLRELPPELAPELVAYRSPFYRLWVWPIFPNGDLSFDRPNGGRTPEEVLA